MKRVRMDDDVAHFGLIQEFASKAAMMLTSTTEISVGSGRKTPPHANPLAIGSDPIIEGGSERHLDENASSSDTQVSQCNRQHRLVGAISH